MDRLHAAKILSHLDVGRGYFRLRLSAPGVAAAARPGQFVMLRVSENLDPLLARPFGIFSVPSRSSIEIIYRVAGRGTQMLSQIEPGHELGLLGPLGNGFPMPKRGTVPIMVSGGSGFPPLHFLATRSRAKAHVFIGARGRDCLPPTAVLRSIKRHVLSLHIYTDDGSAGMKGTVAEALSLFLAGSRIHHALVYACGPNAMLCAVSRLAIERGIKCYVSVEERMACGLGACMGCSIPMKSGGYRRACKEGPVFDASELAWK